MKEQSLFIIEKNKNIEISQTEGTRKVFISFLLVLEFSHEDEKKTDTAL